MLDLYKRIYIGGYFAFQYLIANDTEGMSIVLAKRLSTSANSFAIAFFLFYITLLNGSITRS